jgi:hypothetical protein
VRNPVRTIRAEDMGWMRGLFTRRYPNYFDIAATEQWMREVVLKAPLRFHSIRTDDALCVSLVTEVPWLPNEREVIVVVILADHGAVWQTLPLLRASIAWARRREATCWRFYSDTEEQCAPLLKRIGVTKILPRYTVELK